MLSKCQLILYRHMVVWFILSSFCQPLISLVFFYLKIIKKINYLSRLNLFLYKILNLATPLLYKFESRTFDHTNVKNSMH